MTMLLPTSPWLPAHPTARCCPNCRTPVLYLRSVEQFDVEHSERYRVRDTTGDGRADTFCNIFATDVATAMGCLLPHWWLARELSANALHAWLKTTGERYGWEQLPSAHVAVAAALAGMLTVACWTNPNGPGHVAVVLPIETGEDPHPWIAQAGARNFARARLAAGFGSRPVEFFTCR